MEIAEEEIERAQRRHSEKADAIWSSFKHLVPTEVLGQTGDELYRRHCPELLDRVGEGRDLRPGTAAEVVAGIAGISQLAPPSRTMTLLYMRLFSELFPDEARTIFEETGPMEADSYEETRIAELEAEFRRKLTADR